MHNSYDLIVAGGGLAGTFAAVGAARRGASVALFEQYGYLGGMATLAPVPVFMQHHVLHDGKIKPLVRGLFETLKDTLAADGAMLDTPFSFDDFAMRCALDKMVEDAGVKVLFHSFISDVERDGNAIRSVEAVSKSGKRRYQAKIYIDSTGDGDLAAMAGCRHTFGRDGALAQGMTPMVLLGGIDMEKIPTPDQCKRILTKAYEQNRSSVNNIRWWITPNKGMLLFNKPHIYGKSGVDVDDLSAAEIKGRNQVWRLYSDLKNNLPGFENCFIARCGAQIGVRETRHIVGLYTLNEDDVLNGRKFADGVARGAFEIDIHPLTEQERSVNTALATGLYYEIPFRCLLPADGPDNLLVACRALSADHRAHASLRIMPTMSAVGEAAGIAAAFALAKQRSVAETDGAQLKQYLLENNIMGDPDNS